MFRVLSTSRGTQGIEIFCRSRSISICKVAIMLLSYGKKKTVIEIKNISRAVKKREKPKRRDVQ